MIGDESELLSSKPLERLRHFICSKLSLFSIAFQSSRWCALAKICKLESCVSTEFLIGDCRHGLESCGSQVAWERW